MEREKKRVKEKLEREKKKDEVAQEKAAEKLRQLQMREAKKAAERAEKEKKAEERKRLQDEKRRRDTMTTSATPLHTLQASDAQESCQPVGCSSPQAVTWCISCCHAPSSECLILLYTQQSPCCCSSHVAGFTACHLVSRSSACSSLDPGLTILNPPGYGWQLRSIDFVCTAGRRSCCVLLQLRSAKQRACASVMSILAPKMTWTLSGSSSWRHTIKLGTTHFNNLILTA